MHVAKFRNISAKSHREYKGQLSVQALIIHANEVKANHVVYLHCAFCLNIGLQGYAKEYEFSQWSCTN